MISHTLKDECFCYLLILITMAVRGAGLIEILSSLQILMPLESRESPYKRALLGRSIFNLISDCNGIVY